MAPSSQKKKRKKKTSVSSASRKTNPWTSGIVCDICALTVTVSSPRHFDHLLHTLEGMAIQYSTMLPGHPLERLTVKIATEEEFRFFLLVLPNGNVLYDSLPSCHLPSSSAAAASAAVARPVTYAPLYYLSTRRPPPASSPPPRSPPPTATAPPPCSPSEADWNIIVDAVRNGTKALNSIPDAPPLPPPPPSSSP